MLLVEEGFLKANLEKIHEEKMKNYLSDLM